MILLRQLPSSLKGKHSLWPNHHIINHFVATGRKVYESKTLPLSSRSFALSFGGLKLKSPPIKTPSNNVYPCTNLRSAANLDLHVPKTHPKSIQFLGPTICNNLPPDARSGKSLCNFKRLYQKNNQNVKKVIRSCTLCIFSRALGCVLNSRNT